MSHAVSRMCHITPGITSQLSTALLRRGQGPQLTTDWASLLTLRSPARPGPSTGPAAGPDQCGSATQLLRSGRCPLVRPGPGTGPGTAALSASDPHTQQLTHTGDNQGSCSWYTCTHSETLWRTNFFPWIETCVVILLQMSTIETAELSWFFLWPNQAKTSRPAADKPITRNSSR